MPEALANGITLHYDTFGDRRDPTVLLVMGLGTQMTAWRSGFCDRLASRGLHVVRFDNRDVGLSTKLHGAGLPSIPRTMLMRRLGLAKSAYTLSDMAGDALGVLDALGVQRAHFAGLSMGGMISQTVALEHPSRVRSLTSIMSSTGDRHLPSPTRAALRVLMRPAARDRDESIAATVALFRAIGSPRYLDESRLRERAAEAYDRSRYRLGTARQLDAILCSGPRGASLRALRIPTTVVHGALDPLLPVAHGRFTAERIPGAELRVIDDLGHDLPDEHWDTFADAIGRSVERAS